MRKKLLLYSACLTAGVLGALPAVFGRLFILAWAAPAVMYLVSFRLKREGRGGGYLPALLFSFGFYGTGYSFVFTLGLNKAGAAAALIAALAWASLSLIQSSVSASHLPLAYLLSRGGRNRWVFAIASASMYSLCEVLLTETRYAIPWMNMALTQVYSPPMIQLSSLFGCVSVSLLIMLVSCLAATALDGGSGDDLRRAAGAVAAAVFSINAIVGYFMAAASAAGGGESVRVAAVGSGISIEEKLSSTVEELGRRYYTSAVRAALSNAELLVLPETSIPYDIVRYPTADEVLSGIAERGAVTLIAGTYTQSPSGRLCNALVQYSPGGERTGEYVKRHLVPLSEFSDVDYADKILAMLSSFGLSAQQLVHGRGGLLMSDSANVSGIICFDSLFWDTAADDVREGAELLAVSANDGALGDNFSKRIHFAHTVLRAVESRRYAIRASSGGYTAIIGPDGGLRALADPTLGCTAVATVERGGKISLFCRIGPYPLPCALLGICLLASALERLFSRRELGGLS